MLMTFYLATRVKPYGMTKVSGLDPKGRGTTPPVELKLSLSLCATTDPADICYILSTICTLIHRVKG